MIGSKRSELYCGIDAHKTMPRIAEGLASKAALLRLSLRHYICEAFGTEPDAVHKWEKSVRERLPWREMVENEFKTTRTDLEKIKSGALKEFPNIAPQTLVTVWYEKLLEEKYRSFLPQWRRRESLKF